MRCAPPRGIGQPATWHIAPSVEADAGGQRAVERQHAVRGDAGKHRPGSFVAGTRCSPGLPPSAAPAVRTAASTTGWRGTVERPEHRPLEPRPVVDDRADRLPVARRRLVRAPATVVVERSLHHHGAAIVERMGEHRGRLDPLQAVRRERQRPPERRRDARTDERPNRCRGRSRAASVPPIARRRRWSCSPRARRPCSRLAQGRSPRSARLVRNR